MSTNVSVFKPTLLLFASTVLSKSGGMYPIKEAPLDEFWSGGLTPRPNTWVVVVDITIQTHSSVYTPSKNKYDGLDVFTNMWVSDIYGNALKIINIISKTKDRVEFILEDVDRVNTFRDRSEKGNGSLKSLELIIFTLDDESLPVIPSLPSQIVTPSLPSFISSRFQVWNPNRRYRINKLNHGFEVNDVIVVNQDTNTFEKTDDNNTKYPVIGTVLEVYTNMFFISPINRVIEGVEPALPGSIGDYVYVDSVTGKYTNVPSPTRIYVKLTDSMKTYLNGIVDSPTINVGEKFKINGTEYTVPSTDIADLISLINADTETHGVTMSTKAGATTVTSVSFQAGYGVVGAILPVSATINGVPFSPTTTTSGAITFGAGMADHHDIVFDINNAGIPNIEASVDGGSITIKNTAGGSIEIVNVGVDGGGVAFAGDASCTGLPLSTVASASSFKVYMERLDGGAITLQDVQGSVLSSLGIYSTQNGQLPSGMIVENWNRVSQTFIVDDMIARDNLYPIFTGDNVMVLNTGNGEWGQYMYVNGSFVKIADEDSARTDADVLTLELTHLDSGTVNIGTLSTNSRVTDVTVEVIEAFDNEDGMLSVGDVDDEDRLIRDSIIDLSTIGSYSNAPSHVYSSGEDVDINAYMNFNGSTTGRLKIILSYS